MNRTLLSLNLAQNQISDAGAKELAQSIKCFPLSHEEVVERRKLKSEKGGGSDGGKSPPPSRRADSKDRPGSHRSSSHLGTKDKRDKSSKKKVRCIIDMKVCFGGSRICLIVYVGAYYCRARSRYCSSILCYLIEPPSPQNWWSLLAIYEFSAIGIVREQNTYKLVNIFYSQCEYTPTQYYNSLVRKHWHTVTKP